MNENEIWKPICGFEGLYEVSNLGRVKSLKYGKEKILKQIKDKFGYLHVILCKNGTKKTSKVHRLVGNAFIPNPNNLPIINHKDEKKENNIVENLEWCTVKYNNTYGSCIQRRIDSTDYKAIAMKNAEKLRNHPNRSKKVYQYTLDYKLIKIWESTHECGRNDYNQRAISACCRGERKTHKGYIWSYTELKK